MSTPTPIWPFPPQTMPRPTAAELEAALLRDMKRQQQQELRDLIENAQEALL